MWLINGDYELTGPKVYPEHQAISIHGTTAIANIDQTRDPK